MLGWRALRSWPGVWRKEKIGKKNVDKLVWGRPYEWELVLNTAMMLQPGCGSNPIFFLPANRMFLVLELAWDQSMQSMSSSNTRHPSPCTGTRPDEKRTPANWTAAAQSPSNTRYASPGASSGFLNDSFSKCVKRFVDIFTCINSDDFVKNNLIFHLLLW